MDTVYDDIIKRLTHRLVEIPKDFDFTSMASAWLSGYAQCQRDVLKIIDDMKRDTQK